MVRRKIGIRIFMCLTFTVVRRDSRRWHLMTTTKSMGRRKKRMAGGESLSRKKGERFTTGIQFRANGRRKRRLTDA